MPVTSCPCSAARAAATAESTPPDIAARTRIRPLPRSSRGERGVAGPLDDRRDGLDERVHVGLRRGVAQGEAQRGARELLGGPHRQQDVGGLGHAGVARRPGRALDAAGVEQHQQRVALAPGELEVRVAGQPVLEARLGVAVVDRVRHLTAYAGHERVPQTGQSLGELGLARDGGLAGHGEPGDRGRVDRAGADVALLAAAVQQRGRLQLPAYDERTDAVGTADLVTGHRHRVDARTRRSRGAAGRAPARRRCAPGCRGRGRSRRPRATGCTVPTSLLAHITVTSATLSGSDSTAARNASMSRRPRRSTSTSSTLAPSLASHISGSSTAWCSIGRAQDAHPPRVLRAPRPEQALDREVVRLGAAGGEHHLARPAAQRPRDRLARLLDDPPGVAARGVQRGRVADPAELRGHRRCSFGEDRRGRRVVEIDGHRLPRVRRSAVPLFVALRRALTRSDAN